MPAVSTYSPTSNPYIDGLLSGTKWAVYSFTFSFPASASFYEGGYGSGEPWTGFAALNVTQQTATRSALKLYASVANLSFTEITETSTQHADFRYAQSDGPSTAWAYYPYPGPEGGDAWFNNASGWYDNPIKGNYAYHTFIHEIGHSLGLKHPHEVEGSFGAMPFGHDSLEYTVMSYRSYVGASTTGGYTNGDFDYPQSLMMEDIRAIQQLYGANFTTRAENTTYSWSPTTGEMFINGVAQGAPGANRIFLTVWDGGGTDTYDFSNYTTNLKIDLQPGAWTTTSSAQLAHLDFYEADTHLAAGNIANAYLYEGDPRSLIENALGSSGNDSITGNVAANVLWGGAGGDLLYGLAAADSLYGQDGADHLWGGLDGDYLDGGAGFDHARYDYAGSGVTARLDALSLNTGEALGDTYISIEGLTGSGFADALVGNASNNTLDGKAGNDVLVGGAGADTLVGGTGTDTASYETSGADVTADLASATYNTGEASGDTYASIENLTGSAFADSLRGTAATNVINAGSGNDMLYGRGENDQLYASDDNDYLIGGAGNDTLDGGAGTDTAVFGGLSSQYSITRRIDGSAQVSDLRSGTPDGKDLLWNIERLQFSDRLVVLDDPTPASSGTAFAAAAGISFTGDDAANTLYGSGDNDILDSRAGPDKLYGLEGSDVLIGGAGADVLDGGTGSDTASYQTATAGVTVDLVYRTYNTGAAYGDRLVSIENLTGSAYADSLRGDDHANVIQGGDESDQLHGRGGDDQLLGGEGNDQLFGGAGSDTLDGGAGNDVLNGGPEADILIGGAGSDTFLFQTTSVSLPSDRDTIQDFVSGVDKIDLRQIDANSNVASDQAFSYIGENAFSGKAGELSFVDGVLSGDVNGDKAADFEVNVSGVSSLSATDFWL